MAHRVAACKCARPSGACYGRRVSGQEVVWVLVSALLHALWNMAAKGSQRPTAFLFLLTAVTAAATLPMLAFIPYAALPRELVYLTGLSALTHGASFVALSRAYEAGDLTLVYPISRSTPLVVPLFALPLLGEHLSPMGGAGIALAVLGLWLVQTGGSVTLAAFKQRAALWAYVMLLLTAAFSIVDKRAMTLLAAVTWDAPIPASTVFYCAFTTGAALVALPFALREVGARALGEELRRDGAKITLAATLTWLSYLLILEVLKTAPVSYVVAVRQVSVLFAVGMAMVTLGERPSRGRLYGAAASVAGVALIAYGT
jgi:drug/metabolite transporter (DMT)-like permease